MTKTVQKRSEEVTSNKAKSSKAEDINVNGNMKNLLVSHQETVEDKIATVKTAQMIDKGQFEAAFKTLMKR